MPQIKTFTDSYLLKPKICLDSIFQQAFIRPVYPLQIKLPLTLMED